MKTRSAIALAQRLVEEAMRPASVGTGTNSTQDWWGKGGPGPQGQGDGGVGAQMWRQNMRGLLAQYDSQLSFAQYLEGLADYISPTADLQRGPWESNRHYLERCRQKLAPGWITHKNNYRLDSLPNSKFCQ